MRLLLVFSKAQNPINRYLRCLILKENFHPFLSYCGSKEEQQKPH